MTFPALMWVLGNTPGAAIMANATNTVALGLYRSEGFAEDGRRRNYYRPPGGAPVDAILMSKSSGTA